jgi:hypothetical protein
MATDSTNVSTYRSELLEIIKAWLPVLTVVGAAVWGLVTYLDTQRKAESARLEQSKTVEGQRLAQQKEAESQRQAQVAREATTRRLEAQKPFLTKQLELYFETAKVVGILVTAEKELGDYLSAKQRFLALYWSELAMVEHGNVERAMVEMNKALETWERSAPGSSRAEVQQAAYRLSHAIRDAISSAWSGADQPLTGGKAP